MFLKRKFLGQPSTGDNIQDIVENLRAVLTTKRGCGHFLPEFGLTETGLDRLIKSSYKSLELCTYFTAGPKETKAWTVKENSKAPNAAGVIHSDFEKGFIKAEVISYQDYLDFNGESGCRDNGKLRIEGKDYIVKDGDILHFRFNT